ncbi:hypothetical protein PT286_01775 [Neisseriaceae bacterium ESL0693]|nr:hypothetical protein [Neisseriaceae bacterium ESL0693]
MLPQSALSDMFPVIMTPSHDGKYFHNYVQSLINLTAHAAATGIRVQILMQQGESLITRARNNCVAEFLANPQWTHLFWIDSDIGFSTDAFYRLLLADRDIVAGVYPLKYESWPAEGLPAHMNQQQFNAQYTHYTVNINEADSNNEVHIHVDNDGFIEMEDAPTGFMVIKRAVFEKLMKAFPHLRYKPDSIGVEDQGLHYRFFDCFVDPVSQRYLSEDYAFCRLWNQIGGKIYIDGGSNLSHQGSKTFRGPFTETLLSNLAQAIGAPTGSKMFLHYEKPPEPNDGPH